MLVESTVCAVILLMAVRSIAASEVDAYIGRPVVDVTLVSDGRELRDPSALELVETEVGSALSMRHVRESLTHLFSLGTFEDVRVDASLLGGGVSLRYELVPLGVVERVDFDGETGVSHEELRREITGRHGATFAVDEAEVVGDTLRRYYRARGFFGAQVSTELEGRGADRTLRVQVVSGSRARVGQIFVTGVPSVLYDITLNRLGVATGQPYDGADMERRLDEYEAQLRDGRYYEAELSHTVDIAAGGPSVDLRLDIRRGRRITIVFEGDELPETDRSALVPIEREGSVDEDLLEDAGRRIEDYLNGLGYRDAAVGHRREIEGDDLSIIFSVDQGALYEVGEVVFTGNVAVPVGTLSGLIDLPAGRPLVVRELDDAVASVASHYLRQGFATVRVEPSFSELTTGVVSENGSISVRCEIAIEESTLTRVRSVVVDGASDRAPADVEGVVSSTVGEPYFASQVVADRDAIRRRYLDDGFERVVVTADPRFDEDLETVDLVYLVSEGPQIRVEHVLIVGNSAIDSATIRREVTLQEGEPLSLPAVTETRQRLNALGLFRRIDIREFSHGGRALRDVVVMVDEAPATRVGYGGGLEVSLRLRRQTGIEGSQAVEQLEFAPRGFFQIGRQNLWGKNRSIDLFARISLRRKNDPPASLFPEEDVGNSLGFNEYRILGTFQDPRVFGSEWDGYITGYFEQAIRPGFDLISRGANARLTRSLGSTVTASVDYGWENNDTTKTEINPEDIPLVDRLFPEVRLSSFSSSIVRDTRDDPADPRHGELLGVDAQIAARLIGSEVGFVKTFMQAFLYREVPGVPRFVAAVGARIGLARAFTQFVEVFPRLPPDLDPAGTVPTSIEIPVSDLPLSERFFAGGDTTVRGFALDRLGDEPTIDQDGFPLGGNATLILNGELRARVTSTIDVVGFLDAGNVYDLASNLSLTRIRGGAGFGVRYRSPIGPIRVDLGFKLDRQTFENGDVERPTALHISIGQAF